MFLRTPLSNTQAIFSLSVTDPSFMQQAIWWFFVFSSVGFWWGNVWKEAAQILRIRLEKNIDVKAGGWLQDWVDVTG